MASLPVGMSVWYAAEIGSIRDCGMQLMWPLHKAVLLGPSLYSWVKVWREYELLRHCRSSSPGRRGLHTGR